MPRYRIVAGLIVFGIALLTAVFGAMPARADADPVPEQVSEYFTAGLVPRLIDLYGPDAGSVADTKAGHISRVREWTAPFLAGTHTKIPTQLTNSWVAPVRVKDRPLGLAIVWINPATNLPELADFTAGSRIVSAIAALPADATLLHDQDHSAWFALAEGVLTPLVTGTSGVRTPTPVQDYQASLSRAAAPTPATPVNQGLLIAGITLGVVVVLLATFVLLPDRRRVRSNRQAPAPEAVTVPETPPAPVCAEEN
ncbi:hypothetical protein GCM10027052_18840 [Parafrigoribacterium mesophilum]